MILSSYEIALVVVITAGYIMGVGLGTIAYFANEKNY
ncbi:endonuclease [Waterburya agarophytonicola K14]|uniref:Endonuclease n=1 Tax=Waterburya agarophytonicola KI4 TaxID=2874699 RepID=A0A964FGL5_9CYAN|nr:endonuclease [Waterburya agarophytonicola KI4]